MFNERINEGERKVEKQETHGDVDKKEINSTNHRRLIILGDSMLKHIAVNKLLPGSDSENLCKPGSKVEDLIEFLQNNEQKDDTVTDVIVHTGSNNLPNNTPKV